jgi:hypothetical protein
VNLFFEHAGKSLIWVLIAEDGGWKPSWRAGIIALVVILSFLVALLIFEFLVHWCVAWEHNRFS